MRNWILYLLLCAILIFTGCSPAENNAPSNLPVSSSPATGEQQLVTDTASDIILVQLPTDERFTETQNRFIEDFVRSKITAYVGEEEFDLTCIENQDSYTDQTYSRYCIKINSTISYISDDLISIVFTGFLNNKNAAHPLNLFFTCNFNPNTMQEIRFLDRFVADETLYQKFAEQGEKNILAEVDGEWPQGWGAFSDELCSKEQFLSGLRNENTTCSSVCCYYTAQNIGFSYSVAHALGDHKEVELPYTALSKRVEHTTQEDGSPS